MKQEKKKYYSNLDITVFEDNKKFWKTIRPFFSDKQKKIKEQLILIENEEVISNAHDMADKMNNFFIESIENLDIEPYIEENINETNNKNIVKKIVVKFSNHPSILKIKDYVKITHKFSFKTTSELEFKTQINTLDPKKATVENDIPAKILIETTDISSIFLTKIYNDSKGDQIFLGTLKKC